MKVIAGLIALVLVSLVFTPPVSAQSVSAQSLLSQKEIAAAKEMVERKRNFVVIANLDLTEEEGKEFWPLYDEYRIKIREVRLRRIELIKDYAERYNSDTVDEKFADDAIIEFLDIQADTLKVRKKYWKKFRRIIPATKAARFYQIENKMDSEIDFVMSGGTPLIEAQ